MSKGKKAQEFLDMDILLSPMFITLVGIGLAVFVIQLFIWKKMDFQMIWWVKIVVPLCIPIAAYIFTVINQ